MPRYSRLRNYQNRATRTWSLSIVLNALATRVLNQELCRKRTKSRTKYRAALNLGPAGTGLPIAL